MIRPLRLALAAAIVLAISALLHLPVALLVPADAARLSGPSGHWRDGGLRLLLPPPAPPATLSWSLQPSALLSLTLAHAVQLQGEGLTLSLRSHLPLTGPTGFSDGELRWQADGLDLPGGFGGNASFLATGSGLALDVLPAGSSGSFAVHHAAGELQLRGLRLRAFGQQVPIGDFAGRLSAGPQGELLLDAHSLDAVLELAGRLVLRPIAGGRFHLSGELLLTPIASTPDDVIAALAVIARRTPDQRFQLRVDLQL